MNKYIAEQHFMISLLTPTTYNLYQPWFKVSPVKTTPSSGTPAPVAGLYNARFWVDGPSKNLWVTKLYLLIN